MSYYSTFGPNLIAKASHSEDLGLTFDLPLSKGGPSQLPTNMTVDGYEVAPTFRYSSLGVRENLLGYTEDFSNGAWNKTNVSVDSNVVIDPLGTTLGDGISATTSGLRYVNDAGVGVVGEVYTASVHLKAGASDWVYLYISSGLSIGLSFNLSNGTVGSTVPQEILGHTMTEAGNGWYRCSVTFVTNSTTIDPRYYVSELEDDYTTTTIYNTPGFYIWGAQLNSGPLIPYYDAGKASTGPNRIWLADVGPDLDYSGSGDDMLIRPGPFTDGAPIIKLNGGKHFISPTGVAGPGTKDTAIEIVIMNEFSNAGVPFEWADSAASSPRVECYTYSPSFNAPQFGGLTSTGNSLGGVRGSNRDGMLHQISFADNSELTTTGTRAVSNGAGDTYTSIGGANNINVNMTSSAKISIGARISGAGPADEAYILISFYSSADWFPGGASADDAAYKETTKRRSAQVMGVYPFMALGDKTPTTATRTSNNSFMDIQDASGYRTMHQVAKGWMRVCTRPNADGSDTMTGYLSEEAATQQVDYTDDITLWTTTRCSAIDGYEVFTPYTDAAAWGMIPDDTTTDERYFGNGAVPSSGTGWMSVWVKAGAVDWCALRISTSVSLAIKYFDLSGSGAVGSSVGTEVLDAFIEDWGAGWFRCCMKYTNGTTGTSTVYAAEADLDAQISPANITDPLIHVAFPQIENGSEIPSSYINNPSTGTVTRIKDYLMFDAAGDNVDISTAGTMEISVMYNDALEGHTSYNMTLCKDGASPQILLYGHASNYAGSEGYSPSIQWVHGAGGSDITDGYRHDSKVSFTTNETKLYVDNSQVGATDTSVDMGTFDEVNEIRIGVATNGLGQSNALLSRVKVYNKVK